MSSIATCDQGPSQLLLRNIISRDVISWNYKTSLEEDIVLLFLQVQQMTKFRDLNSTRNVEDFGVNICPPHQGFSSPWDNEVQCCKNHPFILLLRGDHPKIQCEMFQS